MGTAATVILIFLSFFLLAGLGTPHPAGPASAAPQAPGSIRKRYSATSTFTFTKSSTGLPTLPAKRFLSSDLQKGVPAAAATARDLTHGPKPWKAQNTQCSPSSSTGSDWNCKTHLSRQHHLSLVSKFLHIRGHGGTRVLHFLRISQMLHPCVQPLTSVALLSCPSPIFIWGSPITTPLSS